MGFRKTWKRGFQVGNPVSNVSTKMKKYYAYYIPETSQFGITDSWQECERLVLGKNGARFKGFGVKREAEEWLRQGALYKIKNVIRARRFLEKGIYFDAGTGRGLGLIEVNVTNEKGQSLLAKALRPKSISKFGTYVLTQRSATNNYGELFALNLALDIASREKIKKIFGDSRLVIDYWSKGRIKKNVFRISVYKLVNQVAEKRQRFEKEGGKIGYISGDQNPADLGFH